MYKLLETKGWVTIQSWISAWGLDKETNKKKEIEINKHTYRDRELDGRKGITL